MPCFIEKLWKPKYGIESLHSLNPLKITGSFKNEPNLLYYKRRMSGQLKSGHPYHWNKRWVDRNILRNEYYSEDEITKGLDLIYFKI